MASSRQENTVIAGRVIYFLNAHVIPGDPVSKPRHAKLKGTVFPIAPDLAVEVVSKNEDVLKKVNEYTRAGTRLVWAIYPEEKTIYVFHPEDVGELRMKSFGVQDTLDGGDVLPGFTLKVSDIFP